MESWPNIEYLSIFWWIQCWMYIHSKILLFLCIVWSTTCNVYHILIIVDFWQTMIKNVRNRWPDIHNPPTLEIGCVKVLMQKAQGSFLAKDDQLGEEEVTRHPPPSHTGIWADAHCARKLSGKRWSRRTGNETSASVPHWTWQVGRENPDSWIWKTDAKVFDCFNGIVFVTSFSV